MKERESLLDFADEDRKQVNSKNRRPHHLSPVCSHCGAPTWEFRHSLSTQLGENLIQLYRYGRPAMVRDLHLPYGKSSNFQKLRYFGPIVTLEKLNDQNYSLVAHDKKTARWWLTQGGEEFVRATVRVPRYAWTYRGQVVERCGDTVLITDLVPDFNWRIDYAQEARPHEGVSA
jgi:hypothetical protein